MTTTQNLQLGNQKCIISSGKMQKLCSLPAEKGFLKLEIKVQTVESEFSGFIEKSSMRFLNEKLKIALPPD